MSSIKSSALFVLICWKSIIIDIVSIHKNSIYILLSIGTKRGLTEVRFDRNTHQLIVLPTIIDNMCSRSFCFESDPLLNTVQLMLFEVLVLHEKKELIPCVDSYELSPGNIGPT